METKICTRCKIEKCKSEFGKNGLRDGVQKYMSHCRDCERKRSREKTLKHPETAKKYYQENKERLSKGQREWHRNNKESIRERKAKHSKTDLGRETNYRRNMKKRSKKYGVNYEEHSFLELLDLNNWTCQICGVWVHDVRKGLGEMSKGERSHKACADHIIPLAAGGDTTLSNLQILCFPCNGKKYGDDFETIKEFKDKHIV